MDHTSLGFCNIMQTAAVNIRRQLNNIMPKVYDHGTPAQKEQYEKMRELSSQIAAESERLWQYFLCLPDSLTNQK